MLVLSDGADTSDTPIEAATTAITGRRGPRRRRRARAVRRGTRRPAAAGGGRPGPGDLVRPGGARRPRSPPRPTSWRARCWSPPRCRPASTRPRRTIKVTLPTSTGSVTAEAFSTIEPGAALRSSSRATLLDPAVVGALRRPGSPGAGPRVPRGPHGAAQAGAAQRRRPGHPLRRGPGRRWELRPERPTVRCRRHLRLGEGDGGERAPSQQGPRCAHQRPAPGGGQRAQVLRVAARARRAVLPVRPGRAAAGRRQPAHRLRVRHGRTVRTVDLPRLSTQSRVARRSTRACPTPCS